MILIIDNYDSFTYNLVQRIGEMDPTLTIEVHRNDQITAEQVEARRPSHVIISPGPCTPREGGVSNDVIRRLGGRVPLLGVCLGHQCIGFVHGGQVVRADRLMHGKTSPVRHDGRSIFAGLPNPFTATRYHSLIIKRGTLDEKVFEVSAWTDEGEIMGIRHKAFAAGGAPLEGVQFHPESFLTDWGPHLLANFLGLPAPAAPVAAPSA
ncbi:MAG: Aminodeoxychorismate/anthranilate synthase component 2 [Phycisphaerae bacterium]|nr:Aminodeoxychorismate/anthranilate synthase component 2 [Phycisphaerae bacterium]